MTEIIVNILTQVDQICKQFVLNGYKSLVTAYTPSIMGLASLTLAVLGYATSLGYISTPMPELIKKSLQIGFILTFSLLSSYFVDYIYNLVTMAPDQIAAKLILSLPDTTYSDKNSVAVALQHAFHEGNSVASKVIRTSSVYNLGPLLWGSIIHIIVFLIAIFALIELIVAKFGLAILLVLTPLFLPMLFFSATKSALFDGWLRQVLSYALIPLFVLCTLAVILQLMHSALVELQKVSQADSLTIIVFAPFILYGTVGIGMLYRAAAIASSIAGGVADGMAGNINKVASWGYQHHQRKKDRNHWSQQGGNYYYGIYPDASPQTEKNNKNQLCLPRSTA